MVHRSCIQKGSIRWKRLKTHVRGWSRRVQAVIDFRVVLRSFALLWDTDVDLGE